MPHSPNALTNKNIIVQHTIQPQLICINRSRKIRSLLLSQCSHNLQFCTWAWLSTQVRCTYILHMFIANTCTFIDSWACYLTEGYVVQLLMTSYIFLWIFTLMLSDWVFVFGDRRVYLNMIFHICNDFNGLFFSVLLTFY